MLNQRKVSWLFSVLFLAGLGSGCGSAKRIESTAIPNKAMANEEVPSKEASPPTFGYCIVQKHDCLWTIAAQPQVYGDSFEWPLIFKTNRDKITDPDLIYPHQVLKVDKSLSIEERNHGKQMAMATPKYVPHTKPRETLPVDYF